MSLTIAAQATPLTEDFNIRVGLLVRVDRAAVREPAIFAVFAHFIIFIRQSSVRFISARF